MSYNLYSKYSCIFWKEFKKDKRWENNSKGYTRFMNEAYKFTIGAMLGSGFNITEDRESEISCQYLRLMSGYHWYFTKMPHLFLEPGVADFLISATKHKPKDWAKTMPTYPMVQLPNIYSDPNLDLNHPSGVAVHFPAEEERRSIILIPNFKSPIPAFLTKDNVGVLEYELGIDDGHSFSAVISQSDCFNEEIPAPELKKYYEYKYIAIGLFLYMNTFPDSTQTENFDDVFKSNHYHGPRGCVYRNEFVDESEVRGMSPHVRAGHWRVLRSERFTNKRWQSVFVRPAFVRGRKAEKVI